MVNSCWEIVHIPGKPPLSPTHQPTGKVQLSVILCLTGDNGVDLGSMPMDLLELTNYYHLSPFVTQVCKYAATTKEEWEEQCKLWPTSFHPPTYNIDGITGFNEEDSKVVFNYMNVVLKLSKSAGSQFVNAAVIVDPSSNLVITSACDEMSSWNMHLDGNEAHLLDSTEGTKFLDVANQSSLNFNLNGSPCDLETSRNRVSCINPWQWSQQHSSSPMSCSWNPLRHAAMVAIEYSASRDRHLYPTVEKADEKCCQFDLDADLVARSPVKRQKKTLSDIKNDDYVPANGFPSESERPYLCTGYDIYLAWEPCAMCAMALVHQRIRRIFYAFPNPCTGALGSVYRLQGEKSLNHHYAVFQVLMHDEALGGVEDARRIDKDDRYNDTR
ncbi:tRNA-specific adenosine deaminase TAD3 isoform X2 [Amaranthus tricolor]|uniref:tRNA-specific adenosine deaminase TAD3 isoform X2 n=1 Tax=Amaranthus tricolor TaxID=29722 RepID=UPI00258D6EA0|nr:tRNA-specific adenosine deaminase TAD3 isoform X2 [Amaranthus tricolor]XP_057531507.1 tRNA-specific adenosine deaminase TAD3 isoform X2 [Amaranthus tricolor]